MWSNDNNVDPVGACVGARGARVRLVVNELRGEKIDIVPFTDDPFEFVAKALSPAKVKEVRIDEDTGVAEVIVPDYQLSLAIGKEGQNARLSARLTGLARRHQERDPARRGGDLRPAGLGRGRVGRRRRDRRAGVAARRGRPGPEGRGLGGGGDRGSGRGRGGDRRSGRRGSGRGSGRRGAATEAPAAEAATEPAAAEEAATEAPAEEAATAEAASDGAEADTATEDVAAELDAEDEVAEDVAELTETDEEAESAAEAGEPADDKPSERVADPGGPSRSAPASGAGARPASPSWSASSGVLMELRSRAVHLLVAARGSAGPRSTPVGRSPSAAGRSHERSARVADRPAGH